MINWCNNNSGFVSILVAIASLTVSIVAIGITLYTSKKERAIALYDTRLQKLAELEHILDFISVLRLYKQRLESGRNIEGALKNISFYEIQHEILQDIKKMKFMIKKRMRKQNEKYIGKLESWLRNYRMLKEDYIRSSFQSDQIINNLVSEIYISLDEIEDETRRWKRKIENFLR